MARRVTTIPATLTRIGGTPIALKAKRRVAGYARVSTELEEQATSYEAQVDYYTRYIQSKDDWEFVKVYTDEGISATNTIHRLGFQEMIKDALDGKIDLIVTKSVSRFARNTVDSLTTVRMLKEKGIEIYFEKENIWTLDSKGELLITIMSSLAQEESRSISENTTWGHRKRFADGVVYLNTSSLLGYRKVAKGKYEIIEEEAEIIRYIYSEYLAGTSISWIGRSLEDKGISTSRGSSKWSYSTIKSILSNEKYTGNALLQKTIGVDFLTKKRKVNEGEVPQYYVEGSHPAIIEQKVFDAVQDLLKGKAKSKRKGSIFSGMVYCADCGSPYISKTWHSTDKYRRTIWQCEAKYQTSTTCSTPHFKEEELKELAVKAINQVLTKKKEMIAVLTDSLEHVLSTTALKAEDTSLENELTVLRGLADNALQRMSIPGPDQREASEQYEDYSRQHSALIEKYQSLSDKLEAKKSKRLIIEGYIVELKKQDQLLTEFDPALFSALVSRMKIHSKDKVEVEFRDGSSIVTSL